jgi:hypothetical protein
VLSLISSLFFLCFVLSFNASYFDEIRARATNIAKNPVAYVDAMTCNFSRGLSLSYVGASRQKKGYLRLDRLNPGCASARGCFQTSLVGLRTTQAHDHVAKGLVWGYVK